MRPYLKKKKPSEKRVGGVVESIGPEFKSQYQKKVLFLNQRNLFAYSFSFFVIFWETISTDFVYFQKNEKTPSIYRAVI
jgi:hypothetical protein